MTSLNKPCDICERHGMRLTKHYIEGPKGDLCEYCQGLVSWVVSNGWLAQRCMQYLLRSR